MGLRQEPELLTCWKDIANYLGKGVRTVQRWEQTLDLPVRRPNGNAYKSSVLAHPKELDVWLASRGQQAEVESTADLGSLIEASRNLHRANHELAHGVGSALAALMQSCVEMTRYTEDTIPKQKTIVEATLTKTL